MEPVDLTSPFEANQSATDKQQEKYSLLIDVYSVRVKVITESEFVFNNLAKDFQLFVVSDEKQGRPQVKMSVCLKAPPYERIPPVVAALHGEGLICYKDGNISYVVYSQGGLLVYDFKSECGELFCENSLFLYEKIKITILSRIGELLDRRGLHRIHAFAVARKNKALMCLMPMEGGKTTTMLNLLRMDPDVSVIADDVCLIDRHGRIFPFLLRVGARDQDLVENISSDLVTSIDRPKFGLKYFIDLNFFKGRIATPMRLTHIMIGRRAFRDKTEIKPLAKIKCIMPMIESGVFGLGLPQLLEFFVRGDFKIMAVRIGIILKRVVFCIALLSRAKTCIITIGRNKRSSCGEILRFLKGS